MTKFTVRIEQDTFDKALSWGFNVVDTVFHLNHLNPVEQGVPQGSVLASFQFSVIAGKAFAENSTSIGCFFFFCESLPHNTDAGV